MTENQPEMLKDTNPQIQEPTMCKQKKPKEIPTKTYLGAWQNIEDEELILNAAREIAFKGRGNQMLDFSIATMKMRSQQDDILNILGEYNFQLTIVYIVKIIFQEQK